jgi:putative membrane protein
MKRILLNLATVSALLCATACSSGNTTADSANADSTSTTSEAGTTAGSMSADSMAGAATTDAAAGATASATPDPNGPTAPHSTDPEFMKSAAHSDQNEIQLSKLALEKGVTGMAKTHAEMMIKDHTKSTTDLKAIAQKKNVTLPTDMDAEHKAIAEQMRKLSGKELEKQFMNQMVLDHQKTLNTMAAHQAMTKDPDLQGFITKTTPVVANHLTMSKEHAGMM